MSFKGSLKKAGAITAGYLVLAGLFFTAYSSVFVLISSDKEKVQTIIEDSGAYDSLGPALVDELSKSEDQGRSSELPLENEKVRKIAENSVSEKFARQSTEGFLDDLYEWLEGERDELRFSVSLNEPKEQFINRASAYAYNRASDLPPCSGEQLTNIRESNVFDLPCRPPGLSQPFVKNRLRQAVNTSGGFIAGGEISSDDIAEQEGPFFETFSRIPDGFKQARLMPWIFGAIAILFSIALVYLSSSRRSGVKWLAIVYLAAAVLVALMPVSINIALGRLSSAENIDSLTSDVWLPILSSFNSASSVIYWIFAVAFAAFAGAFIAIYLRFKNQEL